MRKLLLLLFVALVSSSGEVHPEECRNEKFRPQLHFSVPANWLNDPNGMFFYEGEYHLHYQYNPESTQWGPMHWGHAVSTDLIHWTDLPISLYPDELGTIFSGSAVVDFSNSTGFQREEGAHPVVAVFTHATRGPQMQSIAYSLNRGRDWTKFPGNPVLPNPGIEDFRDPKVFRFNNEKWVMVLAVGNKVQFYGSADLQAWEFLSEFGADPMQGSHAGVWECPDMLSIEMGGSFHSVLLVSINPGGPNGGSVTQYFVGSFDGRTFHSDQVEPLWMDWGEDNYAGVSFFNDPEGRAIVMGWMSNWNYAGGLPTTREGFNGGMTLPRLLQLTPVNGAPRLRSSLPPELNQLRDPAQVHLIEAAGIPPNQFLNVSETLGFKSPLVEVDLAFNIAGIQGTSSVAICFVNRLRQEVCVGYDHNRPADKEIFLNRELSGDIGSIGNFIGRGTSGRVRKGEGILTFKILLDTTALELFVDGGLTVMTSIFFPDEPLDTIEIRHHADTDQSQISLISGSVRGLKSIYDC